MDEKTLARFLAKVDKNGPVPAHAPELGPCWLWCGPDGTPYMTPRGYAARQSYALHVEPIADGLYALHRCDNGHLGCVNPDHLYPGTPARNARDRRERPKPGDTGGRPRRGPDLRPTISIRMDPDLLTCLDEAARRSGQSRTEYVEAAIRAALAGC